jgi:hypothetical protein
MRNAGFSAAPWWKGNEELASSERVKTTSTSAAFDTSTSVAAGPLEPDSFAVRTTRQRRDVVPTPVEVDIPLDNLPVLDVGPATVPSTVASGGPATVRSAQAPGTQPGPLKAINTQEMLDVRQQAEFFMALGQHNEAVRLLESNIRGSADANPLVYLDLLKILHTLSRRADFETLREEFNLQFTGRIPEYADFLAEGNGLEAYEDICHQIMVLWPTEYTIDFIEQCLVRMPEDDPEQGIDLEAFKDLLLLYGVLKRLDQFYDSSMAPFSASRPAGSQFGTVDAALNQETVAPLPALPETLAAEVVLPVGMDIDLDIDLDISDAQVPQEKYSNLIDFDVTGYTDAAKPAADK